MPNPFSFFQIPISFKVDKALLTQKFISIQKQHHPDTNPNNASTSLEASQNYQILTNPIKRGDTILEIFNINQNSHPTPPNFFPEILEITEQMLELSEDEAEEMVKNYKKKVLSFPEITELNIEEFTTCFIKYKYIAKAFQNSHGS